VRMRREKTGSVALSQYLPKRLEEDARSTWLGEDNTTPIAPRIEKPFSHEEVLSVVRHLIA